MLLTPSELASATISALYAAPFELCPFARVALEPLADHADHVRGRGEVVVAEAVQQRHEPEALGGPGVGEAAALRGQRELQDAFVVGVRLELDDAGPHRGVRELVRVLLPNAQGAAEIGDREAVVRVRDGRQHAPDAVGAVIGSPPESRASVRAVRRSIS